MNHASFTHFQPHLQAKINNCSIAQRPCHHLAIYCIAIDAALRRRVMGLPKMIRDNKIIIRLSHFDAFRDFQTEWSADNFEGSVSGVKYTKKKQYKKNAP